MISTTGPNKNLLLRDKIFLWMCIIVCVILMSIYLGIVESLVMVAMSLIYACFGDKIKNKLRGRNMLGEKIQKGTKCIESNSKYALLNSKILLDMTTLKAYSPATQSWVRPTMLGASLLDDSVMISDSEAERLMRTPNELREPPVRLKKSLYIF